MDARVMRIWHTMNTEGWPDIVAILDEMAQDARESLIEIMVRKPETLTGKTAIAKANRTKALTDFKTELYALIEPVNKQRSA